jgi:hypothetical protein
MLKRNKLRLIKSRLLALLLIQTPELHQLIPLRPTQSKPRKL